MCFDRIHLPSPTLPRSPLFPFPPNFVSFFFLFLFLSKQGHFVLPKHAWMCGFPVKLGDLITDYTLRENWPSLFNNWVAHSSSARGETSFPTSLCMTGCDPTWACGALWVLLQFHMGSCPVVSSCFLAIIHYLWLLHSFWPLSCNHPWSLGGAVIDLFSLALST